MKLSYLPIKHSYFTLHDDYGRSARIYKGYTVCLFMDVEVYTDLIFLTDVGDPNPNKIYYVEDLELLFQDTFFSLMEQKDDGEYRYKEDIGLWQIRDDIELYKMHRGSSSFRNFIRNLCEEFDEDVKNIGKVFTGTSDLLADKIYSMAMGDGKNLTDLIMKFVDTYDAEDLEKFEFYTRDIYWTRNRKEVCLRRLINRVNQYESNKQ